MVVEMVSIGVIRHDGFLAPYDPPINLPDGMWGVLVAGMDDSLTRWLGGRVTWQRRYDGV